MVAKKKSHLKIKVVFDANVLYAKPASNLVNEELSKLIQENTSHADLSITWHLPSVVVKERRRQMRDKAYDYLPTVKKLETLLDHGLAISEETLNDHVDRVIEKSKSQLSLEELEVNHELINWEDLIDRACYRKLPFDKGKEKGFRDSIIAETFLQLVNDSPKSPSVCRIVLVSNDGDLSDCIKAATRENSNVKVLSSVDELESYINILASKVTENFVKEISDKVSNYFFTKDDNNSLYYKEGISNRIKDEYKDQLNETPKYSTYRENKVRYISNPIFLKKKRQSVYWSTPITVEFDLFKCQSNQTSLDIIPPEQKYDPLYPQNNPFHSQGLGNMFGSGYSDSALKSPTQVSIFGSTKTTTDSNLVKSKIATGNSKFEVHWKISVSQTVKLSRPKIGTDKLTDLEPKSARVSGLSH